MLRSAGVGAATLTAKAESKSGRPMFGDRFSCLADSKSMARVCVVCVGPGLHGFLDLGVKSRIIVRLCLDAGYRPGSGLATARVGDK